MNNQLPKQLYYVKIKPGGKRSLGYSEKGGGKYTVKQFALDQRDKLRSRGINCDVYTTQEIEWRLVMTADEVEDKIKEIWGDTVHYNDPEWYRKNFDYFLNNPGLFELYERQRS